MPPRATTLRADKVLHFIQLEIMNEWRLRLCETIRLIDRSPRPKKKSFIEDFTDWDYGTVNKTERCEQCGVLVESQ